MKKFKKVVALLLSVIMIFGILPMSANAAYDYAHNESQSSDGYYKIVNKTDWDIAPGIKETEIVLNNDAGDRRQVVHLMEADMTNPYTRVISSYTKMDTSNYAISTIPEHAAFLENEWGENVVGAMNTCLSWYNSAAYAQDPSRVNEPLGFMMVDSEVYFDHSVGFPTCIVINKDVNDAGETRPDNIPKVEMRTVTSKKNLTGWEDQVIPSSSGYIVKDGVNQAKASHDNATAARSVVGVTSDGRVVAMMNDGRQAPYSLGMNMYECAEVMLAAGCVYAANCDGGGSSTFMSQRPGEDLNVNCSPCDGSLRENTHGIMFISTAPATGEFYNAYLDTEFDYYQPYSTVEVTAVGRDFSGAEAEVPAEAVWSLADDSFGTLTDGVFVSNGKTGEVEVLLSYNDEVVGSKKFNIVVPEVAGFSQASTVIPYGKSVALDLKVTYGEFDLPFDADDFTFEVSDASAGTLDGLAFAATSDASKTGVKITATYKHADLGSTTLEVAFGKGSEILYDFEDGDISNWLGIDDAIEWAKANNPSSPILDAKPFSGNFVATNNSKTFVATVENGGKVKKGNNSLGVELDFTNSGNYGQWAYNQIMNVEGQTVLRDVAAGKNATRLGMWVYIPEELAPGGVLYMQTELYCGASSTSFARKNTHLTLECNGKNLQSCKEADIPEDRWVYCYMDLTPYGYVALQNPYTSTKDRREPQFMRFYTAATEPFNAVLYIDDITLDYSNAVEDRNAPVISDTAVNVSGTTIRSFTAKIADYTASNASGLDYSSAKISVDGVALDNITASGTTLGSKDVTLTAGKHTVTFEIADNMGNVTKKSVDFTVDGTAPVAFAGHNDLNNTPQYDSVYYADINVQNIENIDTLTTDIKLNFANTWELENMIVADGFKAEYTLNKNHNTATITVKKTEDVLEGAQTLLSIPVRVWSWDAEDAGYEHTAIAANSYPLVIIKADVLKGEVKFADGKTGTFNGALNVNTALTTSAVPSDWHIHTVEELEDKPATCTAEGFTGRTYCNECGSVIDFGETVDAKGHKWEVNAEGKLACVNGNELFNGVYTDGKTYVDGLVIADGWFEIDGVKTYYYIDGKKLTGPQYIDGTMYTFDDNGVYQADKVYEGFFEVEEGHWMYFVNNKHITGLNRLGDKYYNFDENGKAYQGVMNLCGYECTFDKGVFVPDDQVILAGLCGEKIVYVMLKDGRMILEGEGPTYDFSNVGLIPWYDWDIKPQVKSIFIDKDITAIGKRMFYNLDQVTSIEFEAGSKVRAIKAYAMGLMVNLKELTLPDGLKSIYGYAFYKTYNMTNLTVPETVSMIGDTAFSEVKSGLTFNVIEGSFAHTFAVNKGIKVNLIIPVVPEMKQGIVLDEDGELRYYIDDVAQYAGLVQDENGDYYYFGSNRKAKKDCYYGISKTNGLLPAGGYWFGKDGKLSFVDPNLKQGVVKDEDGEIRYYIDGVAQYAGLVKDTDGKMYYFGSDRKAKKDCYYGISKTNDLLPPGGYWFDKDGVLSIKNPNWKQGIVKDADGEIRYYIDNIPQYAGLVQDADGNYYYIGSNKRAKKDCYYGISKTNGLLPAGGYWFDQDGVLCFNNPNLKQGIIKDEDGEIRYYIDGIAQYAGVVKDENGNYYYFGSNKKAKKDCYYGISKTNGLVSAGGYWFDKDGKMLVD